MLLGNFFYIISSERSDTVISARLGLNEGHEIFRGHFPGRPVVPGVCQVQMLEELLSVVLDRPLLLASATQVKFLFFVDPHAHPQLDVTIKLENQENAVLLVEASYIWGETVFFKLKGTFDEYRSA